jgi:UDP-GlcNAc:undecaprenyl-phosphate GlcNAc-1-phosphate transferase
LAILRRIFSGRHSYEGDRGHLHFRLLDAGFSQRQAVLILYFLAVVFGLSSLFLQSKDKVVALIILALAAVIIFLSVLFLEKRTEKSSL